MSLNNTQKLENSQTNSGVFYTQKLAGETLAVFLDRFRKENDIDESTPVTYAGRLDPMALGEMMVLVGEDCKRKDEFLGFDKTYDFEVLFGVQTDTFDMLGLVTNFESYFPAQEDINKKVLEIKNTTEFQYPPYSSKPVGGVPLFSHARSGTLPEKLPTIKGFVKKILFKGFKETTFEEAIKEKLEIIKKIEGDFRQQEILTGWQNFIKDHGGEKCLIGEFEATVSSGVYIRTLATILGGLAYSIRRIRIVKPGVK